jgi:hypothetical protein
MNANPIETTAKAQASKTTTHRRRLSPRRLQVHGQPEKSTTVYTHPIYGNVVIVSDPGRADCIIHVRNVWTDRIHAVTRHELSNCKTGGAK